MAAATITLEQTKARLRVTHSEEDDVIAEEMEEAEAMIFGYLKFGTATKTPFEPETPWTPETVPAEIRKVILHTVAEIDSNRGDGPVPSASDMEARGWPSPFVKGILDRWRDPTYA
jgi:Phage gp6-like head-tail connector protein